MSRYYIDQREEILFIFFRSVCPDLIGKSCRLREPENGEEKKGRPVGKPKKKKENFEWVDGTI